MSTELPEKTPDTPTPSPESAATPPVEAAVETADAAAADPVPAPDPQGSSPGPESGGEATPQKFIEIPLSALRVDTLTEFNIYLKHSEDRAPVLYRDAHLVFGEEQRRRLADGAVAGVYVAVDDRRIYLRYLESYLADIISDPQIDSAEEGSLVYACATNLVQDVLDRPVENENIRRAQRMVASTLDHLLADQAHFPQLLERMAFDYHTYTHSVNVCVFGLALGQRLGLSRDELLLLGTGLLLHDIGKSTVDDAILNKRGRLTDEEWQVMRGHPEAGARILEDVGGVDPRAMAVVLQHHEKCSGKGYPKGLSDPDIHLYAKIGALADVFDALTTQRSYKEALDAFPAMRIMQNEMMQDFQPRLFREFIRMLGTSAMRQAAQTADRHGAHPRRAA